MLTSQLRAPFFSDHAGSSLQGQVTPSALLGDYLVYKTLPVRLRVYAAGTWASSVLYLHVLVEIWSVLELLFTWTS